MSETNPITLPMVRIVKRCSGLTVAQKWLWMDLYPYYRQGCWQTASEQGVSIGLAEESVDRYRRVLLAVGLARQGVRARQGRRGRPGHTWFAAFPEHIGGMGRKISDDDVARLAEVLDRHLHERLSSPDNRTSIRVNQRQADPNKAYPDTGNVSASAGGASRGEGGRGMGLSFDSKGECPCSSQFLEEGQTPTESKEEQRVREPLDSLEPTEPSPDHGFSPILVPSDLAEKLAGFVSRNTSGARL